MEAQQKSKLSAKQAHGKLVGSCTNLRVVNEALDMRMGKNRPTGNSGHSELKVVVSKIFRINLLVKHEKCQLLA